MPMRRALAEQWYLAPLTAFNEAEKFVRANIFHPAAAQALGQPLSKHDPVVRELEQVDLKMWADDPEKLRAERLVC